MSSIPANYILPGPAMASVSSAENADRLAQVQKIADVILSDDPKVSQDQKLEAFNSLNDLVATSWRADGARDAISMATWLKTESPIAKQLQEVGNRYQAMGMSEGRAAQARGGDEEWTGGNPIKQFSRFSESDQKLLLVALGLNTQYGSVREAYDDFQRQSDEAVARYQASKQTKSVEVSLSDEAKAVMGVEKTSGTAAERALASLKANKPRTDKGWVALMMLEKASEARTQAKADDTKAAAAPAPDSDRARQDRRGVYYRSGDKVDKSA